jgi:hypothetical protein
MDYRIGIFLIISTIFFYYIKSKIQKRRVEINTIHDKLERNMNYIKDESIDMIQTIKLFSKEDKHI